MAAIHRIATTASMMGYCMEIGWPHERHRPRSSSHETTGTLSRHAIRRPLQGHTIRGARTQRHAGFPRPGDEASVVERHDGVAEGGAHGRAQRLGAGRIGRAPQHHRARGSERVRRTDQRADVPGILYAVDHQRHGPRGRHEVARRPAPRLDDGDDPLRRFGVGQLSQDARADFLHCDGVPFELRDERRTARGACQVRGDQGPGERDSGGERLFHEPYALDQGEAAPAARLAALEITYRRLQITGDESPRAFPAAAEHSICEEASDGRYVKIALTIAGSDSGGGAGIQADLKTFHQFGVFGTSVITAVTAQNTMGVWAWEPVPAELVTRRLDGPADALPPAAVKSGMLGSATLVETVAAGIARH